MRSQLDPPFRAEHVGSLLRPPALLDLRARFERGELTREALQSAEDAAIKDALALQQRLGFKLATDGEFRRESYHGFFYRQLGDIGIEASDDASSPGQRGSQPMARINSRIQWTKPIHVTDFKFIAANSTLLPKVTIPGPCVLHFRGGDAVVLAKAYRDVDQFWDDVIAAFRQELAALAAAGCRYVQIDETAFAKFDDRAVQATLRARGDDPDALIDKYITITNRVLADAPASMRIGMHLCRGNRGGRWHAEGGYDPVAERLFNALNIPFYYLEYDSPRAGTFMPLRFVPPHKAVVLGVVSTKTPVLENKDDIKRRIDEATRYIDLDRLALSPQCGFASLDTGGPMSPAVQEQKLRLVVELAREIWGDS